MHEAGPLAVSTAGTLGLSALVALVVTGLANGLIKFVFDDQLARRNAKREKELALSKANLDDELSERGAARDYDYERLKELRALVGRFKGRLLQAALDLEERLRRLETAPHEWLRPRPPDDSYGYFFRTTVYRFAALQRLAVAFEREAIYFDTGIASPADIRLIRYAKAFQRVMSDVNLFAALKYDPNNATDHFFLEDLRKLCTYDQLPVEQLLTYEFFDSVLFNLPHLDTLLVFFNGINPDDTPLRWDRLAALRLLLTAFIDSAGYDESHRRTDETYREFAASIASETVRANLLSILSQLRVLEDDAGEKIKRALEDSAEPVETLHP